MGAEAAMHFCIRRAKATHIVLGMKEQTCSIYWGSFLQVRITVLDNHDIYSSALLILYLQINIFKNALYLLPQVIREPSKGLDPSLLCVRKQQITRILCCFCAI